MKKFIVILMVLVAVTNIIKAQIPNGGFEIWENFVDNGDGGCTPPYFMYEKPNSWSGSLPNSCTINSYSLKKNNESYPAGTGQFSLRIQPDLANGVSGTTISNDIAKGAMVGWIPKPSFAINKRPASLFLYYKSFPFGGDTTLVLVYFYKKGVVIGNPAWGTTQTVASWTPLEMPMTYNTSDVPDSASILFTTGAYVRHSETIIYIDNLSFDGFATSIATHKSDNPIFSLYPNPASGIVTLNIENRNNAGLTLNIYNVTGTLFKSEMLKQDQQQVDVADLSNGIYMVEIKSKEWTAKQKLTIQK